MELAGSPSLKKPAFFALNTNRPIQQKVQGLFRKGAEDRNLLQELTWDLNHGFIDNPLYPYPWILAQDQAAVAEIFRTCQPGDQTQPVGLGRPCGPPLPSDRDVVKSAFPCAAWE
jgi:hypothetical protein